MILTPVGKYYTEEEKEALDALQHEEDAIVEDLLRSRNLNSNERADLIREQQRLAEEVNQIRWGVENRYIKDRKQKGLLADVAEIVGAITKEDFLARIKSQEKQIAILREQKIPEEELATLKEYSKENYDNAYFFILYYLRVQLNGLGEAETEKAIAIVEKRASQWYIKPTPAYVAIPYGAPTSALSYLDPKKANKSTDNISQLTIIEERGVVFTTPNFQALSSSLNINTDKLMNKALELFAKNNDFSEKSMEAKNRIIAVPVREYAKIIGYDAEVHPEAEDLEKEKKRAKTALDNARRKGQKDLESLYDLSMSWKARIKDNKGKYTEEFFDTRLISSKGYSRGNFIIEFSPVMADYLVRNRILTQYATSLYSIPATDPNAYRLGKKMIEYYNMDTNANAGRNNRLSTLTLLAVTTLPTYEEVQEKDRGHWAERIKEPLEDALERLVKKYGTLKSWTYTHEKGVPLSEEEAYNIDTYDKFKGLYIMFEPATKVDHTERRQRRLEEKNAKKKQRNKKK